MKIKKMFNCLYLVLGYMKWIIVFIFIISLIILLYSCRSLGDGYYLRFFAPYYNGKPIYDAEFFRFKVLRDGFATDGVINVYKGFTFSKCPGLRILDKRFVADDCYGFIYRQNGRILRLPNSDGESLTLIGRGYVQDDSYKAFFDDGKEFVALYPENRLTLIDNNSQYDATDTLRNYLRGNVVDYTDKYWAQKALTEEISRDAAKNCGQSDLVTLIVSRNGQDKKVFTEHNHYLSVERLENKLYFVEDNDKVIQYDIFSGEKKIIFTLESANLEERRGDEDIYLRFIGDNLFVSIGGYLVNGKLYAFRLPNIEKPIFIESGSNLGIEGKLGRYFVSGGEGDGGWGYRSIAMLDIKNYKISPSITLEMNMEEGSMLIGFTERGYLVSEQHMDASGEKVIDKIYYADYKNPAKTTKLFSDNEMPERIIYFSYDEEAKDLLLLASSSNLYSYNLDNERLLKIKENISGLINEQVVSVRKIEGDSICLNGTYQLNLETGITENVKRGCAYSDDQLTLKDKIIGMNLPSEYRYECTR